MEKSEIKARQARIEEQLKEEFSVDFIDKTEAADPRIMKKLNKLQKTKGWVLIIIIPSFLQSFNCIKKMKNNYLCSAVSGLL